MRASVTRCQPNGIAARAARCVYSPKVVPPPLEDNMESREPKPPPPVLPAPLMLLPLLVDDGPNRELQGQTPTTSDRERGGGVRLGREKKGRRGEGEGERLGNTERVCACARVFVFVCVCE